MISVQKHRGGWGLGELGGERRGCVIGEGVVIAAIIVSTAGGYVGSGTDVVVCGGGGVGVGVGERLWLEWWVLMI